MSYMMQYALPSKREGVGLVPIYILGINISAIPIWIFLSFGLITTMGTDAKSVLSTVYTLVFLCTFVSPSVGLLGLIVSVLFGEEIKEKIEESDKNVVFSIDKFTTLVTIAMILNPLVYFIGALTIDYLQNRVWSQKISGFSDIEDTNVDHMAYVDSIQRENIKAMKPNPKLPIQAYKCTKVFSNKVGSFYAIKDASLVLKKGETIGLLGPNGAGKSTLFNLLSTYHSLTEGTIRTFGKNLGTFSSFFKQTGICTQDDVLWSSLTLEMHMTIMRILFGIPSHTIQNWIDFLELSHSKNQVPNQLSSGMKRKLCFMFSACSNPLYKFMDEPTTGLDPIARKRFREIVEFQKNIYGSSSILTTHTMNEAERTCDKIVIIVNG